MKPNLHSRTNMIEGQLRPNGVTDARILAAIEALPRETFAPRNLQSLAYVDDCLPLGHGRYLMEPMVLARLLQAAAPAANDIALDIACGTGYSSAVMAQLCTTVVATESQATLARTAQENLRTLDLLNVAIVEQATLAQGYPQQAPYNVIFINSAVSDIPDALLAQLADGGRLVAVVKPQGAPVGQALLISREGDTFTRKTLFDTAVPTLGDFSVQPLFCFE